MYVVIHQLFICFQSSRSYRGIEHSNMVRTLFVATTDKSNFSELSRQITMFSSGSALLGDWFWQCSGSHEKFNLVSLFVRNFFLSGFLNLPLPLLLFPRHPVFFV